MPSVRGRRPRLKPPESLSGLPHKVRIIGGRWRGRKLVFPAHPAIRPTPDRIRETLFNWLQGDIVGARCLDLFAGSGALGFEALSRGAAHMDFVEREPQIANYLRTTLLALQGAGEVIGGDALEWLARPPRQYEIVFLDPPFGDNLLPKITRELEAKGWLAPRALIYMEMDSRSQDIPMPANWELTKSKTAGQVGYHLALRIHPV